jgi:LPS sulfotransferase NodH
MSKDYVRFVVLCDARTGSSLLVEALQSHPEILCFREVFDWERQNIDFGLPGYDGRDSSLQALRRNEPVRFLREMIYTNHDSRIRAVGFKFIYVHYLGHTGLLDALIADTELHVVHLQRRNSLRWYVSLKLAEATGEFSSRDAGRSAIASTLRRRLREARRLARRRPSRKAILPLRLDEQDLVRHLYRARHEQTHFAGLFAGHPSVDVWYEDMEASVEPVVYEVEQFLGVSPCKPAVTLTKQNPEPLHELIANYDELRQAFAGTEYGGFFDG